MNPVKRVYLASRFNEAGFRAFRLARQLIEEYGFQVVYDWTADEARWKSGKPKRDIAHDEALAILGADALVLYPLSGCRGAWVEFGLAWAWHKPIVLIDNHNTECGVVFECLDGVHCVESWTEAVELLKTLHMEPFTR